MSKTFGVLHSDRVALALSPFVYFLGRLFAWPTRGLIGLANVLLPGKGIKAGPFVSEEEIRSMAQVGSEEGSIDVGEKELIHSIFEFGDTIVREVMVPRPDVIAIERVFSQQNVSTVMGTAQAGGVIALAAAKRGIDVHFHTPSEVKAAVTGNGNAGKAQVTAMVTRILALQTKPTPADAADALALAICQLWRGAAQSRLAAALAREGA